MAKIENDKYYTPKELAEYIVNKTKEVIGEDNITEYVEPSAGAGVFLDYLDKPYLAYDILPEDDRIVKQDYLTLDLEYKKGRCVIGNPPFMINKAMIFEQFYNNSVKICDYIAFILPISQLNNDVKLYKFDLIYSEDLGECIFTDRKIHCCFNIYKRPINNKINKKHNYDLKDITIINVMVKNGVIQKHINFEDFDISICNRGNGTIGKIINTYGIYNSELHIKINNEKYKNDVIKLIKETDFKLLCESSSSKYIPKWRLYKYLKEQIPELE